MRRPRWPPREHGNRRSIAACECTGFCRAWRREADAKCSARVAPAVESGSPYRGTIRLTGKVYCSVSRMGGRVTRQASFDKVRGFPPGARRGAILGQPDARLVQAWARIGRYSFWILGQPSTWQSSGAKPHQEIAAPIGAPTLGLHRSRVGCCFDRASGCVGSALLGSGSGRGACVGPGRPHAEG